VATRSKGSSSRSSSETLPLEIRPVEPGEQEAAGRVTARAYQEFVTEVSGSDYLTRLADVATRARHALVLGAFEGGRPVGTVTLEVDGRIPGGHPRPPLEEGQAHVRMLGVDPRHRRRGVGRALMDASIAAARTAGKRRITLETTEAMVAAQRLYESMGFRRGRDHVFDDGFRLRTYELTLD
jgi:ribosomal protein S18 acetylase RimI-like enzyme